jgi:hypothetical protein
MTAVLLLLLMEERMPSMPTTAVMCGCVSSAHVSCTVTQTAFRVKTHAQEETVVAIVSARVVMMMTAGRGRRRLLVVEVPRVATTEVLVAVVVVVWCPHWMMMMTSGAVAVAVMKTMVKAVA